MERRRNRKWLADKVSELSDKMVYGTATLEERKLFWELLKELQERTNRELMK